MMSIRDIFGEDPFEFQRPLLIVNHDAQLKHASEQFDLFKEQSQAEIKKTIEEIHERHIATHKVLWSNFENLLKEKNLFPFNFNKETDSLCIDNGVVKHCRRKIDHAD